MTEMELVLVGLAAVLGGGVNALAGGGTLITFPVLLAVGVPAVAANITNTVALCPGYLGGTIAQLKDLRGEQQKVFIFGITGALGGVAGGVLLLHTAESTFRTLVPYLILLATALLAIEGPVRRWQARRSADNGGKPGRGLWKAIPVFMASVYGGYFGAGLSVIVLAVLALISNQSLTRVNALKQVIGLFVNIAAALFFLFSGQVVWSATVVMAIGSLAGGVVGGLVAAWVSPSVLRAIVVVFGIVISIVYFVR